MEDDVECSHNQVIQERKSARNGTGLIIPKGDPLEKQKKYLKNLYELCRENSIDPGYVDGIRQRIFEITTARDLFLDDYCPMEILLNIVFDEVPRGKERSEQVKIRKACDILEKLEILELIEKKHEIIICTLHKPQWGIKKSQMKRTLGINITKSDFNRCNNIIDLLRNSEEYRIWIITLAVSLAVSPNKIWKLIDLINQSQREEIISVQPIKKIISGYRVRPEEYNEREITISELRREEHRKKEEEMRNEAEKRRMEIARREAEEAEKERLELERIKEYTQQQKKRAEELRIREEEERAERILAEKAEKRKQMKKKEWKARIKKFTLLRILRGLYLQQKSIDDRMLKLVCHELNIETSSNNPKDLMNFIYHAKIQSQPKIEALIEIIPNFLEKVSRITRENYEIIPFAKKKERAKKLLIEYLGGTYKYNPKTDLDRPRHVQQTLFKKPKYKSLNSYPATPPKTIIVEAEDEKEKAEIHSKSTLHEKSESQSITAKEEGRFKEISDKLEIYFEKDRGEIELDSFIQKTGYNEKDILEVLETSEVKSKYQLNFRTTPVKFVLPKKVTLRNVKRNLKQKWKMRILPKRDELAQLLELLEKKTRIEMSILCENLNLPEDKIVGLLKELDTHGGRDLIKYKVEEKEIRVVRKVN